MDAPVRDDNAWNQLAPRRSKRLTIPTETQGQQQEQDQPAPFQTLSPDQGTAEEEIDGDLCYLGIPHRESEWRLGVYKMRFI
jgi:hypothetical protein